MRQQTQAGNDSFLSAFICVHSRLSTSFCSCCRVFRLFRGLFLVVLLKNRCGARRNRRTVVRIKMKTSPVPASIRAHPWSPSSSSLRLYRRAYYIWGKSTRLPEVRLSFGWHFLAVLELSNRAPPPASVGSRDIRNLLIVQRIKYADIIAVPRKARPGTRAFRSCF